MLCFGSGLLIFSPGSFNSIDCKSTVIPEIQFVDKGASTDFLLLTINP